MFTTPKLTEEEGKPAKERVRMLNFIVDPKYCYFCFN
jgi:hypothetical protein